MDFSNYIKYELPKLSKTQIKDYISDYKIDLICIECAEPFILNEKNECVGCGNDCNYCVIDSL